MARVAEGSKGTGLSTPALSHAAANQEAKHEARHTVVDPRWWGACRTPSMHETVWQIAVIISTTKVIALTQEP